ESTLFAPAGQRRFRIGAPDFGCIAGASRALGRFAHQERLTGAPGERKRTLLRSMRPPSPRNHPAGGTAGSARTRSRDSSLENPFLGNRPSPNAASGRLLRLSLPPSTRTFAPFGTKRSAQAPYSWGLGA